jgi:FkbM family methyltransferase
MITYAQNFEDVMLWRALGHIESGFYVDIGAQDPVADSVSLAFYERGWRGVHVEPVPVYAQALREARPDETVLQAAIGEEGPLVSIFEIPNTGLSTAKDDIAQVHEVAGFASQRFEVACVRLADLLDRWSDREVHWLKIDVEGMEGSVLRSWAPSSVRPWIVLVEATVPRSQEPSFAEWEPVILHLGYKFAYFDGLNRFYVSKAHRELLSAFAAPPNVFDGFALSGTACNGFSNRLKELVANERAEINRLSAHQVDLVQQLELARKDAEHTAQAVHQLQQSKEDLQIVQREMRAREEAHTEEQATFSQETKFLGLRLEERDAQITQARADQSTTRVDLASARAELETAKTECERMPTELKAERAQWLQRMDAQEHLLREVGENARLERNELQREVAEREAQVFEQLSSGLRLLEERADKSAKERADLQLTHAQQQALLADAHAEHILQMNEQLRVAQETMAFLQAQIGAEKKERADLSQTHARQQTTLSEAHDERERQMNARYQALQETANRDRESARQIEQSNAAEMLRTQQESARHALSMAENHATALQAAQREYANAMHDQMRAAATIEIELRERIAGEKLISEQLRNDLQTVQLELAEVSGSFLYRATRFWRRPSSTVGDRLSQRALLTRETSAAALANSVNGTNPSHPQLRISPISMWTVTDRPDIGMERTSNSMRIAHTIEELLSLYDTAFIECAYWTILGRKVDPSGLKNYLNQVRKGVSKGRIIAELIQSQEGRARTIELPGISELLAAHKPRSRSWLGWIFRREASQRHQGLEMKIHRLENCVGILANELSTRCDRLDTAWSEVNTLVRREAESIRGIAELKAELLRNEQSTRYDKLDIAWSEVSALVRQQADSIRGVAELKADVQRLTLCFAWPSTLTPPLSNPVVKRIVDRDPTPRISVGQLMANVLLDAHRTHPEAPIVTSANGI